MKMLILIGFMLCLAAGAIAQQPPAEKILATYEWKDLMAQHSSSSNCEIVAMDGMSVLKIEKTNNAPLEIVFLTITNSSLLGKIDNISFDVKYDDVERKIITVTNHFPSGTNLFFFKSEPGSITLLSRYPPSAQGGDENISSEHCDIEGTSNWKPQTFYMDLIADPDGTATLPVRMELTFHMPATGTVYLRPIKLIGHTQGWLSPQLGVVIGVVAGIGGAGIGCFGALIGCLVGLGKARRFVLAMVKTFIGLGIVSMIAGIIAAACHQPWPVWYSMLLMGFVLTIVFSINLYPIKRRYDELEIRRMTSMDASGG